jgi:nucleoside 2-deoxyribosyltransferase
MRKNGKRRRGGEEKIREIYECGAGLRITQPVVVNEVDSGTAIEACNAGMAGY